MPADAHADRLLLDAVRRAPGWATAVVAAAVASAASSLLLPAALGGALDAALGRAGSLSVALLRLGAVVGAGVLAEILTELADTAGAARTTARLRHTLIRRMLLLGPAGQRRFGPGDATSRVVTGAGSAGRVVSALLATAVGLVTAAGALVALALVDWRTMTALLVGTPVAVVSVRAFVSRTSARYTDYQDVQGEIAERLVEALAGIRTIRACGTVRAEIERVTGPLPRLAGTGRELWRAQRGIAWSMGLLVPLLQVTVIAVSGLDVSAGRITAGDLVAALGYATLALGAIEGVDGQLALARARAGARRVSEVFQPTEPAESAGLAGPARPVSPSGRRVPRPARHDAGEDRHGLCLRRVTVRAEDGGTVLHPLDLTVPAGAVVAVVGRSGSGKSTLVALPGRLIEPDSGEVLVNGTPVSMMDDTALRSAVSYAFSQPVLLGRTVLDALGYGGPAPSPSWIAWAASVARADGFVRLLPRGYQTPLAEVPMSGGEAQRLGLARALAQDASVLILDDATSNLDTATEADLTAALTQALVGQTRLVVAHRVATAAGADLVAWLDNGRLRAFAPHTELWSLPDYRAVFAEGTC